VRDWLFVEDHARALTRIAEGGTPGATYLVSECGGRNIDIVHLICDLLDRKLGVMKKNTRAVLLCVRDRSTGT